MIWGVLQHQGKQYYYEIEGEKVKAHEMGVEQETRTPELLEAIRADMEKQARKHRGEA